jgi:hypothetical protein
VNNDDGVKRKSPLHKAGPGRPVGSINRYNLLAGKHLEARGVNLIDEFVNALAKVQNQEAKANLILKAMPYIYPQLSAIAIQNIPADVQKENGLLSNEELFAKAKLIMERNQHGDSGTSINGSETREIENRMGEDGHSTGGNSDSKGLTIRTRTVDEAEDGENQ